MKPEQVFIWSACIMLSGLMLCLLVLCLRKTARIFQGKETEEEPKAKYMEGCPLPPRVPPPLKSSVTPPPQEIVIMPYGTTRINNSAYDHLADGTKKCREDGLTEQEGKAMDALITAWNIFIKLDITHPSDKHYFENAIHTCQQILGMRVLQRDYPNGWPTKK